MTTRLRAGYSRKNGVPYSANTNLTEYYHPMNAPNGDKWLTVISEIRDPQYLSESWVVSSHFKKVSETSRWNSESCSASSGVAATRTKDTTYSAIVVPICRESLNVSVYHSLQ